MKFTFNKLFITLSALFGLLSLFSIWNVYHWDVIGWGNQLFLFPFLTIISLLASFSVKERSPWVFIQTGLMLLHWLLYFLITTRVIEPRLLLFLLPVLFSSVAYIWSKAQQINELSLGRKPKSKTNQIYVALSIALLFYVGMAISSSQILLLPGILVEILGYENNSNLQTISFENNKNNLY